jgi:hypothetical protein
MTQSKMMYQIYSDACFTISADRAKFADQGFLKPRNLSAIRSCAIPTSAHRGFSSSKSIVLPGSKGLLEAYLQGPFFRGWIFQDRLFSRRILHFGHFMTTWECHGGSAGETRLIIRAATGPRAHNARTQLHHDVPIGTLFAKDHYEKICWTLKDWYKDLNLFTCTRFTRETDKLSAIAGLAMTHFKWLEKGTSYFAGIWSADFPKGLAWRNASIGNSRHVFTRDTSRREQAARISFRTWRFECWTTDVSRTRIHCTLIFLGICELSCPLRVRCDARSQQELRIRRSLWIPNPIRGICETSTA